MDQIVHFPNQWASKWVKHIIKLAEFRTTEFHQPKLFQTILNIDYTLFIAKHLRPTYSVSQAKNTKIMKRCYCDIQVYLIFFLSETHSLSLFRTHTHTHVLAYLSFYLLILPTCLWFHHLLTVRTYDHQHRKAVILPTITMQLFDINDNAITHGYCYSTNSSIHFITFGQHSYPFDIFRYSVHEWCGIIMLWERNLSYFTPEAGGYACI